MVLSAITHLMHGICYLVLFVVAVLDIHGAKILTFSSYGLLGLMALVAFSHSVFAIIAQRPRPPGD